MAKLAIAPYDPAAGTWVKIKNREYSQAEGRHDFFDERKRRAVALIFAVPSPKSCILSFAASSGPPN